MKVLKINSLLLILFSLMTAICYGQIAQDYYDKGIDYGVAGKFVKAQQEFTKALELDSFYTPAKVGLELVEDALKQRIKTRPALHLFGGIFYHNKGMYDEAVAEFKEVIKINPNYAGAHHSLGGVYGKKGMHDEAIGAFKKAIEINPNYADAHYNLAVTYYHKGEYSLAIKHCDRAVELGCRAHPKLLELLKPYREAGEI